MAAAGVKTNQPTIPETVRSAEVFSVEPPPSEVGGTLLAGKVVNGQCARAWLSESLSDRDWDSFLQKSDLGQFQQSSLWSEVKAAEGWHSLRVVVRQNESILGGFQMLIRRRGFWREGFINKGPVCVSGRPEIARWIVELIRQIARTHRIEFVVTQAPDNDRELDPVLASLGHALCGLLPLITATACISLGPNYPPVQSRMNRTSLKHVRQSHRRGVVVREGSASNIAEFFELMCTSCRRQASSPNPSSTDLLLKLCRVFDSQGLARLTFTEFEGKRIAGLLTLRFGDRVTAWKKGWSEEHPNRHPNSCLSYESIMWAEAAGARLYDFAGMDRHFARMILEGADADPRILSSRHRFNIGFGAEPKLLPLPRVWFRSSVARTAYRLALPALIKLGKVER